MNKIIMSSALVVFAINANAQTAVKTLNASLAPKGNKVIYGVDNRVEVYQSTAAQQKLADSTAAMIPTFAFEGNSIMFGSLEDEAGVCSTERFSQQNSQAYCSGFLVGPDLLVTAGHCVNSDFDCSTNKWVFDYKVDQSGEAPLDYTSEQIYSCKRIVKVDYDYFGVQDYSLIQLDRAVEGRTPLKVRKTGAAAIGESIVVIGHPSGLPAKVAAGARVRENDGNEPYFVANLDTFGGNSGSAVFNETTGEVEGILVRGETDYETSELGCDVVYKCKDDECRGEDVTKITEIKELTQLDAIEEEIKKGESKVLAKLLAEGLTPNMHTMNQKSLLTLAIEAKNHGAIEALLAANADIELEVKGGDKAIYAAVASNDIDIVNKLLKLSKKLELEELLIVAAQAGANQSIDLLIELGVDVNYQEKDTGNTALHISALNDDIASTKSLLASEKTNLAIKNAKGQKAKKIAKALKHKQVKKLINKEARTRFFRKIGLVR